MSFTERLHPRGHGGKWINKGASSSAPLRKRQGVGRLGESSRFSATRDAHVAAHFPNTPNGRAAAARNRMRAFAAGN